jgi:hypothetical protein
MIVKQRTGPHTKKFIVGVTVLDQQAMRNTVREVHQAVRDGVIEDPIAEILS